MRKRIKTMDDVVWFWTTYENEIIDALNKNREPKGFIYPQERQGEIEIANGSINNRR